MFDTLKEGVRRLVKNHGSEVGVVVKIAAHALLPGAPMLIGATEALCDYASNQDHEQGEAALMEELEALGGDVTHLEMMIGQLSGQLDGLIGQASQMAQFGTPPQALEAMINTALETQFSELRDQLWALTPELETVKRQGESLLRGQGLIGDAIQEVKHQLDAALAYNAPLAGEGIVGGQVSMFLGARGRFQSALLNGDLKGAESALVEMRSISPNGNTARVSEMALRATRADFEGAERVARTLTGVGADDPRVRRAQRSLTKLTQARPAERSPDHASADTARYEVGSKIGDKEWTLIGLLGRGGMGSVWKARNSRGREGAVKVMSAMLSRDEAFVSRFQAEIDALDRVSHPSVIDILDWGRDRSGAWYFVMPLIEGQSLRSRLALGALDVEEVTAMAHALASGLVACHDEKVTHRDIKPENIMLKSDGSPVLIDFGIAHQEGVGTGETQMATGGYAPPEQLAGRAVDGTADLFALGMTLAESLGARLDEGKWEELISRLTHFIPSRRGTARSVLESLDEAQREPPPSPVDSPASPSKPRINVGDRLKHSIEEETFYERVIPGVDGGHPFAMAETQVTQALYNALMLENPSENEGDLLPVEMVSWEDAITFCNELSEELGLSPCYLGTDNSAEFDPEADGFRLPFESEWEARGGESFTYAGSDDLDEVAWYDDNSACETQQVGLKKPNRYGLFDMSGNVAEWCNDEYATPGEYYPDTNDRVYRGGACSSVDDDCAVSYRDAFSPEDCYGFLGFRISRSLVF